MFLLFIPFTIKKNPINILPNQKISENEFFATFFIRF